MSGSGGHRAKLSNLLADDVEQVLGKAFKRLALAVEVRPSVVDASHGRMRCPMTSSAVSGSTLQRKRRGGKMIHPSLSPTAVKSSVATQRADNAR